MTNNPAARKRGMYPFTVRDLVMLHRISDPQASPDGTRLLFTLRRTDYDANKGITAVHMLDLTHDDAEPRLLIDHATSPRWSVDGQTVYFLSS